MDWNTFEPGGGLHGAALFACILVTFAIIMMGRRNPEISWIRNGIALGCLFSWIATVLYGFHPGVFSWDFSLPLQFCNFANLFGAAAVALRNRFSQSLLYFWGIALCPWAFLTPALSQGPATLWFWIFWGYHLFIPVSLMWTLMIDRFRPTKHDLVAAIGITILYTGFLFALDSATGWNYGFVGQGYPENPSPVDFLGPYPIRVLWMLAIGSVLFALLYLPWWWLNRLPPKSLEKPPVPNPPK